MAAAAEAPSLEATRALQALALREARALTQAGALGVAVTGSVARGRATAASDVDLWVLGDRSERRHVRRGRRWVSHLIQPPDEARSFDNLCLWDVDELWVVEDAGGHFARLREAYALRRGAVERAIVAATASALEGLAEEARSGSGWRRVLALQEFSWRAASLGHFLAGGSRVPKLGTLATALPAKARAALFPALGLSPRARLSAGGLAAWGRVAAQVRGLWPTVENAPPPVQAPRDFAAQARLAPLAAVMTLRRLVSLELLPSALEVAKADDVAALVAAPWARAFVEVVVELFGLTDAPAALGPVRAAVDRTTRLWRALELEFLEKRRVDRAVARWRRSISSRR